MSTIPANRTCIITGASRGIGAQIARNLGRDDANVVVNYRSSETKAYDVVDDIEAEGGTAIAVQADVTNKDAVDVRSDPRPRNGCSAQSTRLVNNAGITVDSNL